MRTVSWWRAGKAAKTARGSSSTSRTRAALASLPLCWSTKSMQTAERKSCGPKTETKRVKRLHDAVSEAFIQLERPRTPIACVAGCVAPRS